MSIWSKRARMKSLDRTDSTDDAHPTTIHFRVLNGMVDVTRLPSVHNLFSTRLNLS